MKSENWIQRLLQYLHLSPRKTNGSSGRELTQMLMQMVAGTEEVELSCDEVLALIDQYAELAISGEEAEKLMPLIKSHLDKCRDCFEEYEALARILSAA